MSPPFSRRTPLVATLLSAVLRLDGGAQPRPAPDGRFGAIIGAVTDTALSPIGPVQIEFVGTTLHVTTDNDGRFQLVRVPAGKYSVVIRRVGYDPAAVVWDVAPSDTLRPAVELERIVQTLSPVVVADRSVSARQQGFEIRRKQGLGEFFTQSDIEKRNVEAVIDLLRQSKSVRLTPGAFGVLNASSARQQTKCNMQIYVDGIPMANAGRNPADTPLDLSQLPTPKDLMGIEIYAGSATAPRWLPLGPSSGRIGCGAILLWTREGK